MRLRIVITIVAVLFVALHLLFPHITPDAVTVILLLVAIIPWLAPLIKSVELPGGFKIELQEAKEATQKVISGSASIAGSSDLTTSATKVDTNEKVLSPNQKTSEWLKYIAVNDSNLALAGARIEIEKRLRQLAEKRNIRSKNVPLSKLLNELEHAQILSAKTISGLRDLIGLGNIAVHGNYVSPEAAEWVANTLPSILESISDD